MNRAWILAAGLILDLILGDPLWIPHPVVLIGREITFLEQRIRKFCSGTPRSLVTGGGVMTLLVLLTCGGISTGMLALADRLHPYAGDALRIFWCWQCLALKGLLAESGRVRRELEEGTSLNGARRALSRIVGRETASLDEAGIIRAGVETVAENFSDGVMAPMLYIAIGGVPLGLLYKAVNTMDSMVGYENDRYLWFGKVSARLDDAANFLPSRLSALLMIVSAPLLRLDGKGALRIFLRDRYNHASPNSAQTEAACSGALGIRLGGPSVYFGKRKEKPWIGDALREPEPEDIRRSGKLITAAALLGLAAEIWLLLLTGG